ncbi:MAG: flagellar assembly protein FliW [Lachnospiraceae bacterium]|nr:flagellar assembly protein FliW [Lachnospiraceae bacterium]
MLVKTKYFGEIELTEDKVITFENGIFGFEDYKRYTLLYDVEEKGKRIISWLQNLEEETLALPVISPEFVFPGYDPSVPSEIIESLGTLNDDNAVVLLTLTVPSDLTKMTANLKAPIIINSETKKGCQVVAENSDYMVKYNVYDKFQAQKEPKGE